jgi:hypothetical protein
MKTEPIIFKCKANGKKYQKEVNRQKFYGLINALKNGVSNNDNQISTILVGIIPEVDFIMINYDRNDDLQDPIISYQTGEDDEQVIEIKRCHKIIWSILNYYAQ